MDNEHDQTTEAMMDVDGEEEDSGIASNESDSRRDSLSSMASMSSTATSSNDSAIGSDRRSSTSSNVSSMSGMSDLSRSSRTSGHSSAGYPDSVSSSRRSSLSSVQSDDSTTTLRSDVTATSMKSERTRTSGYTKVGTHIPTTNTKPTAELTQIQVVDFANKTHIVRVRPTDKVKDLKVKVQEKLKIAPSQQRLQFQGKMLDDKSPSSVKCLGLQNLSTVHLQGRLQGGALFSTA
eukprot:XP_011671030.1 PREDICTED: dentin sialophosphoprotein [Strongylocentrotus purpuratus]